MLLLMSLQIMALQPTIVDASWNIIPIFGVTHIYFEYGQLLRASSASASLIIGAITICTVDVKRHVPVLILMP